MKSLSPFARPLRRSVAIIAAAALVSIAGAQHFPAPVKGRNGMVVAANAEAARVGVEILQAGGNAVDAAVATGFALAVVFPSAGNVGGGGFMVIRNHDGSTTAIDYREKAPAAAHRDMYLDEEGRVLAALSLRSHLASGVPGSVAGLILAHERYGRLPFRQLIEPAIRLAAEGHALSDRRVETFNRAAENWRKHPGTARHFTKPPGEVFKEGEIFVQPELADVLRRIRDSGHDGFYRGRTADLIVAEMQRGGGLITHEDLAAYRAVERTPVTGTYRGYRIISMPPSSSGGIALIQLLNAIEPYPVQKMGLLSSATMHLMGEAMRRTYADRAQWMGDPDFFDVPIDGLVRKDYTHRRMASFDPDRATPSSEIAFGDPLGAAEPEETTHYSIVDSEGNAVSTTTTINASYGSGIVVEGAGFFLNNEMNDFSLKPGVPNAAGLLGADANAIAPGKRMLSSMTPTIVEDPEGELFMVIGTPGGSTIINTVFQVIVNVIDHGLDIQAAVSMPRFHHQWFPDLMQYERLAMNPDTAANLQSKGWAFRERSRMGRADGIVVGRGPDRPVQGAAEDAIEVPDVPMAASQEEAREVWYYGGADPRGEDAAVGY